MKHLGLLIVLASVLYPSPGFSRSEWVAAPVTRQLPGTAKGKTYFWDTFATRKGTFKFIPDSMLDDRNTLSGEFLVGRFRYAYGHLIKGVPGLYPDHDETISEVILDCKGNLSGTLSTSYLRAGKVVHVDRTIDAEVVLMPNSGPSTVTDLCTFAADRGASH